MRALALALATEAGDRQDTGMTNNEWMDTQLARFREIVATGRYPTMEYLVAQDFEQDLDIMFEFGLRLLLNGVEQQLARGTPGSTPG